VCWCKSIESGNAQHTSSNAVMKSSQIVPYRTPIRAAQDACANERDREEG